MDITGDLCKEPQRKQEHVQDT